MFLFILSANKTEKQRNSTRLSYLLLYLSCLRNFFLRRLFTLFLLFFLDVPIWLSSLIFKLFPNTLPYLCQLNKYSLKHYKNKYRLDMLCAGRENRTLVLCLEGRYSTTKLHPRNSCFQNGTKKQHPLQYSIAKGVVMFEVFLED